MVRADDWFEKHGQRQCSAKRTNGKPCKNYAAPGFGVCWKHGVGGPNSVHRKYKFKDDTLNEQLNQLAADPDRLDLTEELAINRLCLQKLLGKMETLKVKDMGTITLFTDEVAQIAGKMAKIEKDLRMSVNTEQLQMIADQITTIVARHVKDEEVLAAIQDDLGSLAIPEG